MRFMNGPGTAQDRTDHEAADWVVRWEDREHSPTPREQSRWFGWLRRSPRNLRSYLDIADLYERLGGMDPAGRIDVDEWMAERRAPVLSIAKSAAPPTRHHRPGARISRRWWQGMAAASLAGIAAIAFRGLGAFGPPSYQTEVGQQSITRLEDGSIMNLNTRSRAKVRFSGKQRVVELEGEALFTVARDPSRPFWVLTPEAAIRAIGTTFNVHEQSGETRVAVVEGAVQVVPGNDGRDRAKLGAPPLQKTAKRQDDGSLVLRAGETGRVSSGRTAKLATLDVETEIVWRKQKLIFEDAPLAAVAAEFNRYNDRQFRIEGATAQTRRLSGTFDAMHPQSLLLYLQKDDAVTVEPVGNDFVVRARSTRD